MGAAAGTVAAEAAHPASSVATMSNGQIIHFECRKGCLLRVKQVWVEQNVLFRIFLFINLN
jgi:hypothetical protein